MIALVLQVVALFVLFWFGLRPSIRRQTFKEHAHKEKLRLSSGTLLAVTVPAQKKSLH